MQKRWKYTMHRWKWGEWRQETSHHCRRQAIFGTNDGILLIGPLGTNFSEILITIHTFSFKKMYLKMSSGKWRTFCLGLNVLRHTRLRKLAHLLHTTISNCIFHYNDVIMGAIASQITSLTIVYSTVYSAQIKENIKAPRHWPLCGKVTGTGEFPTQMASNAENVSIWWRHHV